MKIEKKGLWSIAMAVAALLTAALAVAFLHRERPRPLPAVPVAETNALVRVVAAERDDNKAEDSEPAAVNPSFAVAVACGRDRNTADRYEERNDALRSIARRGDLAESDTAALMAYVRSEKGRLRAEREAALKNDVLNLLRSQEQPPKGLAEMLAGMFRRGRHDPATLDYCIQHLGAMQNEIGDPGLKKSVRDVFVSAAKRIDRPYAGTALYSLADSDAPATPDVAELRRLALAACGEKANAATRMAAMQLAAERGWTEVLPVARGLLTESKRDAVMDTVAIGTIGLLGSKDDLELLNNLKANSNRRLAPALDSAIRRVSERTSK